MHAYSLRLEVLPAVADEQIGIGSKRRVKSTTHLLRGLLELIMPALLRMEVRERRILEYLATLRAFNTLSRLKMPS